MENEKVESSRVTAEGTLEWGGLIKGVLIIDLTFPSGEKRHFSGTLYGEIVGGATGVCTYNGERIPAVGDTWNFEMGAGDAGGGGAYVFFNPVNGPHARVVCVSAGGGSIPVSGGSGTWTAG